MDLVTTEKWFMFLEPPDAPCNEEVTEVSHHHIMIEWDRQTNDGGAPIKGYIVQRRQGFSSRFIPISKGLVHDTYFRDVNVYPGMDYEWWLKTKPGIHLVSDTKLFLTHYIHHYKKHILETLYKKKLSCNLCVSTDKPGIPGRPEVIGVTKNSVSLS